MNITASVCLRASSGNITAINAFMVSFQASAATRANAEVINVANLSMYASVLSLSVFSIFIASCHFFVIYVEIKKGGLPVES